MQPALNDEGARSGRWMQGMRSFRSLRQRLVSRRLGSHYLAALVACVTVAPPAVYFVRADHDLAAQMHDRAVLEATNHARLIEELIERATTAPRLLAQLVTGENPRRQAVDEVLRLTSPARSLEIVASSGGRASFDPGQESALQAPGRLPPLVPLGDVALSVQEDAFIATQALRESGAPAGVAPWGHARARIRMSDIVTEARLADLPVEGFAVRLRFSEEPGRPLRLLHVAGDWADGFAASKTIRVAALGKLQLEVAPAANASSMFRLLTGLALCLTAVLSYVITLGLLRRPATLRHEVARHSAPLDVKKRALEEEADRRAELDHRLSRNEAFLEQVLLAVPGPIFIKDAAGRYTALNPAFERLVGMPREALLGKTVFDLMPPELASLHHRADVQLLACGGNQAYEAKFGASDGQFREVVCHKATLRNMTGDVTGIVGVLLDITDHKNVERRLGRLNRLLAALSEINRAIARTQGVEELLGCVNRALRERAEFRYAWVRLLEDGGVHVVTAEDADDIPHRVSAAAICPTAPGEEHMLQFCRLAEACGDDLAGVLLEQGLDGLARLPFFREGSLAGWVELLIPADEPIGSEEGRVLVELAANVSFALDALAQEARRRSAESKLQLAARVFENSAEGIIVTDAENRIVMVNKAFTVVTGYAAEEVMGRNPSLLSSGTQGPEFYRAMWQALKTRGEWHGEIENRRKSGEFYPEWLTISEVRNETGELTHHVAVFSDLTARKQFEERLNFLAHYDALTSLPNRVLFTDRLQQALAVAHSEGHRVAVAFLDLDRFQIINETVGHAVGDRLLQEIAGRLSNGVRQGDSVSRLGGDEFALIFTHLESVDEAAGRIARIQEMLRQPVQALDHTLHCSASIGVAVYPDDGECIESLLRNADAAMYRAREEGGNAFRFFHLDMHQRTAERLEIESKLHYALERGELVVYFQPLVSAANGRILGAEALLRWQRPDLGGWVNTSDFVPLLEETGLIGPVGEWVLRTACEENQRWRKMTGEPLFIAVNLSAVQLSDAHLLTKVEETLRGLDFDPRYLEIELTESSVMRDAEAGIRTLRELKALGVRISLDDFGTGYSSLSYLKRLPLDTLKIDRSFIRDTPEDVEATFLTRAIVAMGHSLRLEIVAEGVETAAQAELLRELDCDLLQGYLYSAAVPAEKFREILRKAYSAAVSPDKAPMPVECLGARPTAMGQISAR